MSQLQQALHAVGACLENLALVLAAITVDGNCHMAVLFVLVLQPQTCAQGHLRLPSTRLRRDICLLNLSEQTTVRDIAV